MKIKHIPIPHPSAFVEPEWQQLIRQTATEAEQMGKLHPKQLELIYQQNGSRH